MRQSIIPHNNHSRSFLNRFFPHQVLLLKINDDLNNLEQRSYSMRPSDHKGKK